MFTVLKKSKGSFQVEVCTEKGVREENEDAVLVLKEKHLYAVADGMGGHDGGGECSSEIVRLLKKAVLEQEQEKHSPFSLHHEVQFLKTSVEKINEELWKKSAKEPKLRRAGSTLSMIRLFPETRQFAIAHVGDTRVVRYRATTRNEELLREFPLTKDHNYEVDGRVHKNLLTNCMGPAQRVDTFTVDSSYGTYKKGDLFVISSDGLHDYAEMLPSIRAYFHVKDATLKELREDLLKECKDRSEDNYSFILIQA